MGLFSYLVGRVEGNWLGEQTGEYTEYDPQEFARQQVAHSKARKIKTDSDREIGFDQGFVEGAKRGRARRK